MSGMMAWDGIAWCFFPELDGIMIVGYGVYILLNVGTGLVSLGRIFS